MTTTPRTPVAAALLLAAIAVGGCRTKTPYEKPLTPVRVQRVEAAAAPPDLRYAATIEPNSHVDVAFKTSGYIRELAQIDGRPIQEGDRVTPGTVLARVGVADYADQVALAQARLDEAEASESASRDAYDRANGLFQARALTRPDFEQAKAAYEAAQARVAGAHALVEQARTSQDDTALRSPLAGVVVKRLVERGSLVGPGTAGFVLADVSAFKVSFGAPDTRLARLRLDEPELVTVDAVPGREFTGRITKISPAADPRSSVFDVEVTIAHPDPRLKVGMIATVHLESDARETGASAGRVAVPLTAVVRSRESSGAYAVYVVQKTGDATVVHLRTLTLGPMVGNDVSVLSGLQPGEQVVVSGATIVTDGEHVRIVL